jgi:DNA-binding phage protein
MELVADYIPSVDKAFGQFLEKQIEDKKLSVQEISRRTGLSRTTIYRHLMGMTEPRPRDRRAYAEALGFSTMEEMDRAWMPPVVGPALVSLPLDVADQLEELAAKSGQSPSQVVADMVRSHIAKAAGRLSGLQSGPWIFTSEILIELLQVKQRLRRYPTFSELITAMKDRGLIIPEPLRGLDEQETTIFMSNVVGAARAIEQMIGFEKEMQRIDSKLEELRPKTNRKGA